MSSYGPTQLDYSITPPQLPAGGGPATLEVAARNDTGADVACKQIRVSFPAAQLGTGIRPSSDSLTWAIAASADAPNAFDAKPQPPATGLGAGQAIGFTFAGVQPAASPGPATITVLEATGAVGEKDLTVELAAPGPAITRFTASSLFVAPGAQVTFSWATLDADSVRLEWGEGSHDGGPSGSWPVTLRASTTAVLTAIKGGAGAVTAELGITVQSPQILSFATDPSPAVIGQGGTVTLSWETLYAQRCTLAFTPFGGGAASAAAYDVPTQSPAGGVQETPAPGVYELQAIGNGRTVTLTQAITVEPAVVKSFTAGGAPIPVGGSATLAWEAEWASGVTIVPDPGAGPLAASGSVNVSPPADTTYTLTPTGRNPVPATAAVAVAPAVTSLSMGWVGASSLALGWASNAATATIDSPTNSGPVAPSGRIVVPNPPADWSGHLAFVSALGGIQTINFSLLLNADMPSDAGWVTYTPTGTAPLNALDAAIQVAYLGTELRGQAGVPGHPVDVMGTPTRFAAAGSLDAKALWFGLLQDAATFVTAYVVML